MTKLWALRRCAACMFLFSPWHLTYVCTIIWIVCLLHFVWWIMPLTQPLWTRNAFVLWLKWFVAVLFLLWAHFHRLRCQTKSAHTFQQRDLVASTHYIRQHSANKRAQHKREMRERKTTELQSIPFSVQKIFHFCINVSFVGASAHSNKFIDKLIPSPLCPPACLLACLDCISS